MIGIKPISYFNLGTDERDCDQSLLLFSLDVLRDIIYSGDKELLAQAIWEYWNIVKDNVYESHQKSKYDDFCASFNNTLIPYIKIHKTIECDKSIKLCYPSLGFHEDDIRPLYFNSIAYFNCKTLQVDVPYSDLTIMFIPDYTKLSRCSR